MDIETFRLGCLAKKGAVEEMPFGPEAVVFKVMGKMFALLSLGRLPAQANLKCDSEKAEALREAHDGAILPGFHMNKKHWNTLHLEQLPSALILGLIDHSYDLVVSGLPRSLRQELEKGERI